MVSQIAVASVDHVDLLFVIGDSPSMAQEQDALRAQLPALMHMLMTGEIDAQTRVSPAQDLHVAIVSATRADGGAFLDYRGPYFGPDRSDPAQFIDDFTRALQLGSAAPGANRPLEAALAALSDPQRDPGFLRNDPIKGLSLISVVVVTDRDDCSPAGSVAPETSAACAAQSDALQSIEYYAEHLRALRKGHESMVAFSAITGVPPELVDDAARAGVNFEYPAASDAYYHDILQSPAMQTVPDGAASDQLKSACSNARASAEPGRRLVQTVQRFGAQGGLASICGDDWKGAVTPWFDIIAKQVGAVCLPHALPRERDGSVSCKVIWDLPPPELAPDGTPARCDQREHLSSAAGDPSRPGGQRCEVRQLVMRSAADLATVDPDFGGWYYDDFSDGARTRCSGPSRADVAFTDFAAPPSSAIVMLECSTLEVLSAPDAGPADKAACRVPGMPSLRTGASSAQLVGRSCTPAEIPENGFDDREVYVDTGGPQCTTGACMVYRLRGDPRPECTPSFDVTSPAHCADRDEVKNRVYCTCRCDGADPSASPCACPSGFSCEPVLSRGTSSLAGSYCVRDGTFSAP